MNYLKVLIYSIVFQSLIIFLFSIPTMASYNINDMERDYNAANGVYVHGNTNTQVTSPTAFQPLTITIPAPLGGNFSLTIPFVGEILGFVWYMLNMGIGVLMTIIGFIISIATLNSLFPIWMAPFWSLLVMIDLVCIWKLFTTVA